MERVISGCGRLFWNRILGYGKRFSAETRGGRKCIGSACFAERARASERGTEL